MTNNYHNSEWGKTKGGNGKMPVMWHTQCNPRSNAWTQTRTHKHTHTAANEQRCQSIQQAGGTWHLPQLNIDAQANGCCAHSQTCRKGGATYVWTPIEPHAHHTTPHRTYKQRECCQSATYRFLISTAPLKPFLGIPWIWFSLRSLYREGDRKNKGSTELSQDITGPLALQTKYLI